MKYIKLLRDIYRYTTSKYKFDSQFYVETYKDLKDVKNPLKHYVFHGKMEGRYSCEKELYDNHVTSGGETYISDRETIIIASHESSSTGAPLVGLNLAKEWSKKYNIVSVVLQPSTIHGEFISSSFLVLENLQNNPGLCSVLLSDLNSKYDIRGVYCNSVETLPVLQACSSLDIPTVSLVHEFNDYTRPVGKLVNTVICADSVVVPANIIKKSLNMEFETVMGPNKSPSNISVFPQGKLKYFPESFGENLSSAEIKKKFGLPDDVKIIVGAGYVQPRKGVDIFVDIAKKVKDKYSGKFAFIWIGGGFDPEYDLNYSVWLKKQLVEFELLDIVHFLDHQQSIDPLLSIADTFLLTSRLDPFPNVVIDALNQNKHVICFKNASGFSDFFQENESDATVVEYLDIDAASNEVVTRFLENPISDLNRSLVASKLDFSIYCEQLEELLTKSKEIVEDRKNMVSVIKSSGKFDLDFFNSKCDVDEAIKQYVNYSSKGLHIQSPLPGFSDLEWININNASYNTVPLYEQLLLDSELNTHDCHILDFKEEVDVIYKKKIAVHLHLYYHDLAEEFSDYFKYISTPFDLYVTTCDEYDEVKLRAVFSGTRVDKLIIKVVPNVGRDIGPLFTALKDEIFYSGYDLVGHFHSKKSKEVDGVGDQWRKYLLSNLIGSESSFNQIQNIMSDSKVGLLFAEDMHEVCHGKNQPFIEKLSNDLGVSCNVAKVFPLGTMFWAKPEALLPISKVDFSVYTQEEPLPYDGSYMHAVERLLPAISNSAGMNFVTVYTRNTVW